MKNGHHVFKTFKITWGVVVVLVDCGFVLVSRRSLIWAPRLGKMMIRFQYWQALPTQITDKQFWSLPSCVLIKGKGSSNKPNFFFRIVQGIFILVVSLEAGLIIPSWVWWARCGKPKDSVASDGRWTEGANQGPRFGSESIGGISHQKGKHCFREIKVGEILLHCKLM